MIFYDFICFSLSLLMFVEYLKVELASLTSASAGWKLQYFIFHFLSLSLFFLFGIVLTTLWGRGRKHLIYGAERSRNSLFNHFSWAFNYTLLVWVVSEWNLWKTKRIKCLTSSCCPTAGHTHTGRYASVCADIKWKKWACVCVQK